MTDGSPNAPRSGDATPAPLWGAIPGPDGTRFRLWAPDLSALSLRIDGTDLPMQAMGDGWFERTEIAPDGTEYLFVTPDGTALPDPASRRQAGDVHGPSVVTRTAFDATHPRPDIPWEAAVIYELHIGTFTPEGTFRAAIDRLPHLADLGITMVEILPLAQFGGDRGWGYDGVLPYAPHPAYGPPEDVAAFVDAAHGLGMQVLIDVVYNHFGPDGNYLGDYASSFFNQERHTPWGAGIDYSESAVRRFFLDNARMWLVEYGFDGLRLDAIDHIRDASDPELLVELARECRALPFPVVLTTEDNRNVTHLHEGEAGMDGEWNDDWHNAAHVVLTGETEGYYGGFAKDPTALLATAAAEGFATPGVGGKGGDAAHMPPAFFIDFLQNHDQVGNRPRGGRLTTLADPDALRAMQAVLLLSPHVPMLFMGEEWEETNPFLFFAGFDGDLGQAVTEGRRKEFAGFGGFSANDVPDPIARSSFEASRIDWARAETGTGRAAIARIRDLIALRAAHIVPHLRGAPPHCGSVVACDPHCLAIDWRLNGADLHLRANLGETPATDLPLPEGAPFHLTGAAPGAPRSAAFWLS